MLDHLIIELDTRFDENCMKNLVETIIIFTISEVVSKTSMSLDDFATISLFYEDFIINSFEAELDPWHYKWRRKQELFPKIDTNFTSRRF